MWPDKQSSQYIREFVQIFFCAFLFCAKSLTTLMHVLLVMKSESVPSQRNPITSGHIWDVNTRCKRGDNGNIYSLSTSDECESSEWDQKIPKVNKTHIPGLWTESCVRKSIKYWVHDHESFRALQTPETWNSHELKQQMSVKTALIC